MPLRVLFIITPFACSLLLGGILKVSVNKLGGEIIIIFLLFAGCFLDTADIAQDSFQEVILLGAHLLQDLWQQILKVLGLWVSGDDHQVLTH